MYRIYVYRTNDEGAAVSYCTSRRYCDKAQALEFLKKQNEKHNRKAVLAII